MNPSSPLSLALVEDNHGLAQTVLGFLADEPALSVCGVAADIKGFKKLIREYLPDLAVIDIGLDTPRAGLDLLVWLRLEFPVVKPVILTINQGDVLEAYQSGARGYVLKSSLETLAPTLMEVSRGKLIIPPEVGELFLMQIAASTVQWRQNVALQRFSDREKQILSFLKMGLRREEIGLRLGISFFTVRRHIQNILEKSGESKIQCVLEKFGEVLGA
jgi:DNA-binding NarL/FixJ family response regulator